jgi:hypothetical protein
MLSTCIKGGIFGGLILFVWSFLSWTLIPWHTTTLNNFKDETAVVEVLKANTPTSGMYLLPSMQTMNQNPTAQLPMVFASIKLEGMTSMTTGMVTQLLIDMVAAFFVTWLLTKTTGLSYRKRIGFVVIFALAAGIAIDLSYWNWFCFDTKYTLVSLADGLIGWLLTGIVLAKFTPKQKKT